MQELPLLLSNSEQVVVELGAAVALAVGAAATAIRGHFASFSISVIVVHVVVSSLVRRTRQCPENF